MFVQVPAFNPLAHLSVTAGFVTPRRLFPQQHIFTALCTSDPALSRVSHTQGRLLHTQLYVTHGRSASLTWPWHRAGVLRALGRAGFRAGSAHSPRCHSKLQNTQAPP